MDDILLTAVFVPGENGYSAYIQGIDGVNTQGESIQEAEGNLWDALSLFLSPDDSDSFADGVGEGVIRKSFATISKIG